MFEPWWSADKPWIHKIPTSRALDKTLDAGTHGCAVFKLDGTRMRDHHGLFREFATKLEFPEYFGENWPALSDCLQDMLWIGEQKCFLLVIRQWDNVLAEAPDDLSTLERILDQTGETWGSLGYDGTGAKPIPFNTLVTPD